jgi:hypothetical protein
MNRIQRLHILLCALILLSAGCSAGATPEPCTTLWFGVPLPLDTWRVVPLEHSAERLGMIEHQTLPGCRVTLMTRDPLFLTVDLIGRETDAEMELLPQLDVQRITVRDGTGTVHMVYYDVYDRTESRGFALYRLAYFLVESEDDDAACGAAFLDLLRGLDPAYFPDLPVAQG